MSYDFNSRFSQLLVQSQVKPNFLDQPNRKRLPSNASISDFMHVSQANIHESIYPSCDLDYSHTLQDIQPKFSAKLPAQTFAIATRTTTAGSEIHDAQGLHLATVQTLPRIEAWSENLDNTESEIAQSHYVDAQNGVKNPSFLLDYDTNPMCTEPPQDPETLDQPQPLKLLASPSHSKPTEFCSPSHLQEEGRRFAKTLEFEQCESPESVNLRAVKNQTDNLLRDIMNKYNLGLLEDASPDTLNVFQNRYSSEKTKKLERSISNFDSLQLTYTVDSSSIGSNKTSHREHDNNLVEHTLVNKLESLWSSRPAPDYHYSTKASQFASLPPITSDFNVKPQDNHTKESKRYDDAFNHSLGYSQEDIKKSVAFDGDLKYDNREVDQPIANNIYSYQPAIESHNDNNEQDLSAENIYNIKIEDEPVRENLITFGFSDRSKELTVHNVDYMEERNVNTAQSCNDIQEHETSLVTDFMPEIKLNNLRAGEQIPDDRILEAFTVHQNPEIQPFFDRYFEEVVKMYPAIRANNDLKNKLRNNVSLIVNENVTNELNSFESPVKMQKFAAICAREIKETLIGENVEEEEEEEECSQEQAEQEEQTETIRQRSVLKGDLKEDEVENQNRFSEENVRSEGELLHKNLVTKQGKDSFKVFLLLSILVVVVVMWAIFALQFDH